jgi:hypothetical protein
MGVPDAAFESRQSGSVRRNFISEAADGGERAKERLPMTGSKDRSSIVLCYIASMRAGRTKTTSFSLDDATLNSLKALAGRRHKGNVSALLAEIASREAKFAAAEAYFEKYGVPPLDDEAAARIEAEWRGEGPRKKTRRRAA